MQCLYVTGTTTEGLLRRGVYYGRLKMQFLYVAGTMTEYPLRRGVCLWEVNSALLVCGWDHDQVSA